VLDSGNAVASAQAEAHPPAQGIAALSVRFWGTRGSIPAPGPATAGYGGNTPCLEARLGSRWLIFDSGSEIRQLGIEMLEEAGPLRDRQRHRAGCAGPRGDRQRSRAHGSLGRLKPRVP